MTDEKKSNFDKQCEEIISGWEAESSFGSDISEEIRRIPKLHNKYWSRLAKVRRRIIDTKSSLEDLEFKKTLYYTGKAPAEEYKEKPFNFKITSGEIPMWIKADADIRKLKYQMTCLEEMKKIFEEIVSQINERQWRLNTLLASEKFKVGLN